MHTEKMPKNAKKLRNTVRRDTPLPRPKRRLWENSTIPYTSIITTEPVDMPLTLTVSPPAETLTAKANRYSRINTPYSTISPI